MKTHCPECGEKYKEGPQPDDFVCGGCALALSLRRIAAEGVVIQPIKQVLPKKAD